LNSGCTFQRGSKMGNAKAGWVRRLGGRSPLGGPECFEGKAGKEKKSPKEGEGMHRSEKHKPPWVGADWGGAKNLSRKKIRQSKIKKKPGQNGKKRDCLAKILGSADGWPSPNRSCFVREDAVVAGQ